MQTKNVKLIIFTPLSHGDIVRETLGNAGAGKIGNYDFCSFSTRGTGRYRGNENSTPAIGDPLKYESVDEERIEVVLPSEILKDVISAVRKVHPYEEMAFDVYPLIDIEI